jgi:hypothetical protein
MLHSNVVATLVTNLGKLDLQVRESAGQALVELAKDGTRSDPGAMQILI